MMRVISGTAKGHKIIAPKGKRSRPTTDRVRENIFNILRESLQGAKVLDLFAGSGALGIEALSRGALKATFIESESAAVKSIKNNLAATNLIQQATVLKYDVGKALKRYKGANKKFNLIFLDPPYKISAAELQNIFLVLPYCLEPEGIVVLEYGNRLSENVGGFLKMIDNRRYGDAVIYLFKKQQLIIGNNR